MRLVALSVCVALTVIVALSDVCRCEPGYVPNLPDMRIMFPDYDLKCYDCDFDDVSSNPCPVVVCRGRCYKRIRPSMVKRGCSMDEQSDHGVEECTKGLGEEVCYCITDKCNAATRSHSPVRSRLLVAVFMSVCIAACRC